jgi:hypothetical protein
MAFPDSNHLTAVTIARIAAALLCFCAMVTCVLWSVTISLDRAEKVNERLPEGEKLGYTFGFLGPEKHSRFEEEYERLFSDHALRNRGRTLRLLGALALICFILCIAPFL